MERICESRVGLEGRKATNLQDLAQEVHNLPHVLKPRIITSTHQRRDNYTHITIVVDLQHF